MERVAIDVGSENPHFQSGIRLWPILTEKENSASASASA